MAVYGGRYAPDCDNYHSTHIRPLSQGELTRRIHFGFRKRQQHPQVVNSRQLHTTAQNNSLWYLIAGPSVCGDVCLGWLLLDQEKAA
jgi:hypothetical protein